MSDFWSKAFEVAEGLVKVGGALFNAIRTKDRTKAGVILSGHLATSIAKAEADLAALDKFGADGG